MRSYEGGDISELEVSFLSGNSEVAMRVASGPVSDPGQWVEFRDVMGLPAEVRSARVVIRSRYRGGAGNNDGCLDDSCLGCTYRETESKMWLTWLQHA